LARAHRESQSDDGPDCGVLSADGGTLRQAGHAESPRAGCLNQSGGWADVEVGYLRALSSWRQRDKTGLAMQLSQGQDRQPLSPEGARPPAACT
jgi:hypothetical protein